MSYFLSMVEVVGSITDVCFTVNDNVVTVETQWTDSDTMECIGNAPVREMSVADARVYYKQHIARGFTVPSDDNVDEYTAEYNAVMNAESADLDAMDGYAEQSYGNGLKTTAITTDGTALHDTTEFSFNGACTMEVIETPNNNDLIVLCDELITNFVRHTDGGCIVTVDEENLWLVEDYLSNNILSIYKTPNIVL